MVAIDKTKTRRNGGGALSRREWILISIILILFICLCSKIDYDNDSMLSSPNKNTATTTINKDKENDMNRNTEYHYAAHLDSMKQATMSENRGYALSTQLSENPIANAVGSYWWLDLTVPQSFSFAELDTTYPKKYFVSAGHPAHNVDPYINYVHKYTSLFMPNGKTTSLVEFGNGGGYYAKQFVDLYPGGEKSFVTVEGSGAGILMTLERGVPESQVIQHDLRLPLYLGRRFDVAACTEVVEHVEPPFASQIALTLVLHADVIWFSHKPLGLQNKAWVNHPNERPFKMWKNLFDFYGYDVVVIPMIVQKKVIHRGNLIAYRRDNSTLNKVTEEMLEEHIDPDDRAPTA